MPLSNFRSLTLSGQSQTICESWANQWSSTMIMNVNMVMIKTFTRINFRAHIDYARTSSYSCLFLKEKLYIFQSLYFRDAKCLCAFNKVITLYKVEMLKSEMEFVNQAMLSYICFKNVFCCSSCSTTPYPYRWVGGVSFELAWLRGLQANYLKMALSLCAMI